ncbi:MAG TPA: glycosyltransferase family 9 protein [Candidatus Obscuribacterales bacterium]
MTTNPQPADSYASVSNSKRVDAFDAPRPAAVGSRIVSPETTYWLGERLFRLLGMRSGGSETLSAINSILVVRNDGVGDLVLTGPLLKALRSSFPDAWISLLVRPATRNLVELCPYVDEVLTFDRKSSDKSTLAVVRRLLRAIRLSASSLWRRRFDVAIVPRWEADHFFASYLAYLSGATCRIGYSERVTAHKQRYNSGYDRLFTRVLCDKSIKHELEHNLDIIDCLGGTAVSRQLEVWLEEDDNRYAEGILSCLEPESPVVAVGIGSASPARRWPAERFAEACSWLTHAVGCQVVLVGSPREMPLAEQVVAMCRGRVLNAVGRTTLRQAAALLGSCNFYMGNNTGTMHLAAAMGRPVIEISCNASTCSASHRHSSERFGPWGVEHCLVQPRRPLPGCSDGCHKPEAHCILQVTVDQIKTTIESRLETWCGPSMQIRP